MKNQLWGKTKTRPMTIVLLIFFWPIGASLLYDDLLRSKVSALKKGFILLAWGIGHVLFASVYLFSYSPDLSFSTWLSGCIYFFIGGVAMICSSLFFLVPGIRYEKFLNMTINRDVVFFHEFSRASGHGEAYVKRDLQQMIASGYFAQAYIDERFKLLAVSPQAIIQATVPETEITCKNCGAVNCVREGFSAECEYCGSAF